MSIKKHCGKIIRNCVHLYQHCLGNLYGPMKRLVVLNEIVLHYLVQLVGHHITLARLKKH